MYIYIYIYIIYRRASEEPNVVTYGATVSACESAARRAENRTPSLLTKVELAEISTWPQFGTDQGLFVNKVGEIIYIYIYI